ncbi:hypothetical protein EV121DRAFT_281723 [Schizophyllum commune]
MTLSFSEGFSARIAEDTVHIPPNAVKDNLDSASELLSRILRASCQENDVLKITRSDGQPVLVLHDLGRLMPSDLLEQNLNHIFSRDENTFFVNTSGLCRHWGLYLTAKVDSSRLGSKHVDFVATQGLVLSDVTKLPHPSTPSYDDTLRHDLNVITRRYKDTLLAQVLLAIPRPSDEHKQRWLYCQLQPFALLNRNPFHDINFALLRASDAYVDHHLQRSGATVPLFAVLDEAQSLGHNDYAANSLYGFPDRDSLPYLQRLITAWRGRAGLAVVITGTSLSRDTFRDDPIEMAHGRYRWTSATGGFDAVDSNRQYVTRYLPPPFLRKARYSPRDADDLTIAEGERLEQARRFLQPISFGAMRDLLVRSTTHHALFRGLDDSSASHQYGVEYVQLVTEAFGRFVDHDASRLAIDEPFMLVSCALWYKNANINFLDLDYLRMLPQRLGHVSELRLLRLAFVLARRFEQKPPLRQLFTFQGALPSWANARSTNILLQHRTARGAISARIYSYKKELAGSTSSLTTVACTDADIDRWLDHVDSSPFCILRLSEEGALLLALKLPGDKNVWVALDGRQGEPLTADGVKHALAPTRQTPALTQTLSTRWRFAHILRLCVWTHRGRGVEGGRTLHFVDGS